MAKFTEKRVKMPKNDCDVTLEFPGGATITVQARPSNGDGGDYNGSLDIILPRDQCVTNWQGDDMTPAPQAGVGDHERLARQLVIDLPGDYS